MKIHVFNKLKDPATPSRGWRFSNTPSPAYRLVTPGKDPEDIPEIKVVLPVKGAYVPPKPGDSFELMKGPVLVKDDQARPGAILMLYYEGKYPSIKFSEGAAPVVLDDSPQGGTWAIVFAPCGSETIVHFFEEVHTFYTLLQGAVEVSHYRLINYEILPLQQGEEEGEEEEEETLELWEPDSDPDSDSE